MSQLNRHTDYDQIARTYDRRYQRNPYSAVERTLQGFIGSQPGLEVLEVGCGTGHWLQIVHELGGDVTGLDFSRGMLAQARRRLPGIALVQATAAQLPWQTESFDRVFCINALHHFPDQPAFLAEARRILRKE